MATLFGENLKTLRTERNLSQNAVAKFLNVSWHTISHWETGYSEPSITQLQLLAKFFDVSLDELING